MILETSTLFVGQTPWNRLIANTIWIKLPIWRTAYLKTQFSTVEPQTNHYIQRESFFFPTLTKLQVKTQSFLASEKWQERLLPLLPKYHQIHLEIMLILMLFSICLTDSNEETLSPSKTFPLQVSLVRHDPNNVFQNVIYVAYSTFRENRANSK